MENMNTKGNDPGLKYRSPRNTDQLWVKVGYTVLCALSQNQSLQDQAKYFFFQMST